MGRRQSAAFWVLSTLVVAAGCSVIVPNDIPAFHCTADDSSSCPAGLVCDPTSLVCVAEPTVEPDDDDDSVEDAGEHDADADAPHGPSPLGAGCVDNGDCASKLCGTTTVLTTAIVPNNSEAICTKPCCTSADCGAAFVCFSGATGGNYCVPEEKAKRDVPATGGKTPGQTCSVASDCRSGLCASRCQNAPDVSCTKSADCPSGGTCSGTKRCIDTCCTGDDCGGGSICRILSVSQQFIWACGTANGGAAKDLNQACNDNPECKNASCVGGSGARKCTPPCCKTSDCSALGFTNHVCAYGLDDNGIERLKWCVESPPGAVGKIGDACSTRFDCASQYCDGQTHKCMNICCTDDDCASNETCQPSPIAPPLLRCIKGSRGR